MGLKGYRLWVMNQLDSNVQSPTSCRESISMVACAVLDSDRFVALQVEI
jgi:hypothetical protein